MRFLVIASLLALASCGTDPGEAWRDPGKRVLSLQAGIAALEGDAPQAALLIARRRLAVNRDDADALLIEGKALSDMGQPARAKESLLRAAGLRPNSGAAQFGLGRLLLAQGEPDGAEAAFRKALAIERDDALLLTDLGIALDMQEKHAEAQAFHRRALDVSPTLDAARVNLGVSLALSGDAGGGVEMLRPLGAGPGAPRRVRHDLAAALAMNGDRPGAERLLRVDLTQDQAAAALSAFGDLRIGLK